MAAWRGVRGRSLSSTFSGHGYQAERPVGRAWCGPTSCAGYLYPGGTAWKVTSTCQRRRNQATNVAESRCGLVPGPVQVSQPHPV